MKKFEILADGTVDTKATTTAPEKLYGFYDKDSFQVHFSETETCKAAQIAALSNLFDKATSGKSPERVKQRSKNLVAFTLKDEPNVTASDVARQAAFNELKTEAANINKAIKAAQANTGGNQQQNPPSKGGQQQGQNGQQQGQNGQQQNQNGQQQNQNGQQQTPTKGGQQQSQNGQQQKFDKTKDAFGRPLKQSYPGLFWPNMTPQEEEAACDEYWAMVRHVDKDIFHKP